jgi:hypothetical protein
MIQDNYSHVEWKHGKVNQIITLQHKWKMPSSRPWYIELKILFTSMINYMKFFDFAIIIF